MSVGERYLSITQYSDRVAPGFHAGEVGTSAHVELASEFCLATSWWERRLCIVGVNTTQSRRLPTVVFLRVAQSGQSARFGAGASVVQIHPWRPVWVRGSIDRKSTSWVPIKTHASPGSYNYQVCARTYRRVDVGMESHTGGIYVAGSSMVEQ